MLVAVPGPVGGPVVSGRVGDGKRESGVVVWVSVPGGERVVPLTAAEVDGVGRVVTVGVDTDTLAHLFASSEK